MDDESDHPVPRQRVIDYACVDHGRSHPAVGAEHRYYYQAMIGRHERLEIGEIGHQLSISSPACAPLARHAGMLPDSGGFCYMCTRLLDGSYIGRSDTSAGYTASPILTVHSPESRYLWLTGSSASIIAKPTAPPRVNP